jgi:hypothetical protein
MSSAASTISKLIATIATQPIISKFTNCDFDIPEMDFNNPNNISMKHILVFFLILIILLGILLVLGTYFFNLTIPRVFPSMHKITFSDFIGLYIVARILFN